MSLKAQSLGSVGAAGDLIQITGATNATPIVITLAANHGLKNGDRIAIANTTGLTSMNGEWSLLFTGTNTAALQGSAGNGAFGGTPRVARIFDQTPLMKGHSAVMQIGGSGLGTLTFTGFESYAEFAANDNSLVGAVSAPIVSNGDQGVTNTNATSASAATKATSAVVIGATNLGSEYEVKLNKYMHSTCSAYTSGTFTAKVMG